MLYGKYVEKAISKVTIVATGPLTNIALLIKTFPEIIPKIAKIVIMGGGIDHGNVTDLAEFNIWTDPEAAQIVFSSPLEVVMAGLDVTEKTTITKKQIASLQFGGPASKLAGNLLHFYQKSGEQFGFTAAPVHDLVAMEYAIWPEFLKLFRPTLKLILITEMHMGKRILLRERRE
ncbi:nucleoside hydrolase [Lactobacillus sp. R2/2]|nr:nucleoside hydrolase [Lactobacillus sp. R2/2]